MGGGGGVGDLENCDLKKCTNHQKSFTEIFVSARAKSVKDSYGS